MTFKRATVYTWDEFKNRDILKELNKTNNLLNHIKRHRRLYTRLVCIAAMMLISGYVNPVLAIDPDQAIARINDLGNQLLKLARTIGYWVVILMTTKDCIGEAMKGGKKEVGNIVVKGIMIMAVLYFLPELFSMMESIVLPKH